MRARRFGAALLVGVLACHGRDDSRATSASTSATMAASETTGATPSPGSFPQAIVDDYGDTVRLTSVPTRIVSLNPTTTEILFTIGAGARLIGRSHWDTWPAATQHVPDLGNGIRPNVEAVIAAHPDLVILYASADNKPATQRLRSVGIATLAFKTDRIAEFDRATRTLGRVIGDTTRATIVADSVRATLNRVRAATASLPHPRVVWPFMYRPVMVVGGGSYLDELLTIAGARNVYASLTAPSPIVSLEDVVRQDPEYILRSADATQVGAIDPAWRAVRAVREGHVLMTQTDIVGRPSVNLGMAAVQLATLLHPGLVLK